MTSQYELSHSLSGTGAHSGWGSTDRTTNSNTDMSTVPTTGSTNLGQGDRGGPTNLTPSSSIGSFVNTDEKRPLVAKFFDLTRSLSTSNWDDPAGGEGEGGGGPGRERRTLGWLGGVFASVALGQLSTNAFLRVGKYFFFYFF